MAPQAQLDIRFPQRDQKGVPQKNECCELVEGDTITRVRFHDYAQVFSKPGLYNQLFGGPDSETRCVSPQVMAGLLREHLHLVLHGKSDGNGKAKLRVLDLGAGNGMVGEEIRSVARDHGVGSLADSTTIVGFDILPEAKAAADRDRPGVYDTYVIADITEYVKATPSDPTEALLFSRGFNVLTSISALAFGDATVGAFKAAISLLEDGGLVAFNLKEEFADWDTQDNQGLSLKEDVSSDDFVGLIQNAVERERLSIVAKKRYCHRYSVTGEPLYYIAVVAVKQGSLGH